MTTVAPVKNFDDVKPQTPWSASMRDRQITLGLVITAAVASFVIVGVTPMKGKLAYFFVFFAALLALDYTYSRLKFGKAAGVALHCCNLHHCSSDRQHSLVSLAARS